MMQLATRVLSFDSLGALEAHLKALAGQYRETSIAYKEALGDVLRTAGHEQVKEKDVWAQEMTSALATGGKEKAEPKDAQKKIKLFGEKKKAQSDPGWIAFDPLYVRVGEEDRGLAELYFGAVNQMDEAARKMEMALAVIDTLKAKVPQSAGVSVVASFINDVPDKVIVRQAAQDRNAKARLVIELTIPSATPAGA
jgi:hypothetical protein